VYYVTIDCGTTNSRAYVVDQTGKVYSKATKQVGVRDTATTGSQDTLRAGVREIVAEAVTKAGLEMSDVAVILSSGMITSEIGLVEIPHLMAPCGVADLAANMVQVQDTGIADPSVPVYFVRGIKNKMDKSDPRPATQVVGELDFMRGEETQVAGILLRNDISLPVTIVILSSHTKFIPIDERGTVLGSLTTMSGQLYDAVLNHTFVGKSVGENEKDKTAPEGYFDPKVVSDALTWIQKVGLVRSLMFPRFLDVLLDTTWYERRLFLEAMIAAEDLLAIGQLDMLSAHKFTNFVLVGLEERCRLYRHILEQTIPGAAIASITKTSEVDQLSIHGILAIARKAGIVK
jgi:2-dehydro-3-deoxygalactonokinase